MRRRKRGGILAYVALVIGILIVTSFIMPPGFWWFILGVCLVAAGLHATRGC